MNETPTDVRSESVHPHVLVIASRYDLTCDYVIAQLRRRSIPYLRLNSEDLSASAIELDPVQRRLVIERSGRKYVVTPCSLRSVLFRRPVYLRDYGADHRSPAERFSRLQWSAFVQNLMLFDEARWYNDPVATYRAEHKAVQLSIAARLGFSVPATRVTNAPHVHSFGESAKRIAIKGLDTVLLRTDGYEMFGFTTFDTADRLDPDAWRAAPGTIQIALVDKLDIRVTVIEKQVFSASITASGAPLMDDWRTHKRDVQFRAFDLPRVTRERCQNLVEFLGLRFGGIDLALCDGEYYFLEINPTGEWAWLVDAAGLPIDEAIAEALSREAEFDVG